MTTGSGGTTITHAVTGETADLTYAHAPTSGDPLHKVDGNKRISPISGRSRRSRTVNGATLKATFVAGAIPGHLAAPADLDALRFDFIVRGAGGIGADDRAAQPEPDGDRSYRAVSPTATASTVWS